MKYQQERLSECENIILEAKRVLLNEQLDRIANITLSGDHNTSTGTLPNELYTKSEYYKNLTYLTTEVTVLPEKSNKTYTETTSSQKGTIALKTTNVPNDNNMQFNLLPNRTILKKYFEKWKTTIEVSKIKKSSDQFHMEKLNDFIANLKTHQHETPRISGLKLIKNSENPKPSGCFKNRYKTQKFIIDRQRSKIDEQNKIISELKLGIIREDLLKSIENTKIEIREIFSNCSVKLFSKAPLLRAVEERDTIMIQSQKAPKMVQKMHQRAIERAKYREIILERKRLIEDARKKLLEEAIEKKKALEEEERIRNLQLINEQRKRELHLQKIRQEKRHKFEIKLSKADSFYKKLLVSQCFKKIFNNYIKSKENSTLATEFNLHKQKDRIFKGWLAYVEAKYKVKYDLADAHFQYKALANAFKKLREWKMESIRLLQVAEDLYDFRLTSNTFIHWHRWVCKQIMLDSRKMQISIKHNNRKMLFQYFYQWRSLPVVLQLEKAKEEKKRKWREKVWEILPDYQPPKPS